MTLARQAPCEFGVRAMLRLHHERDARRYGLQPWSPTIDKECPHPSGAGEVELFSAQGLAGAYRQSGELW